MRVVINDCFGGFGLSPEAELRLYELGCKTIRVRPADEYWPPAEREKDPDSCIGYKAALSAWREYRTMKPDQRRSLFLTTFSPDEKFVINASDIPRDDPMLFQVIEEMGAGAAGRCGSLKIVEIPDGTDYEIAEYDGSEHVAERHRTWS